ncbi:MAG TPA: hypothetical protein VEA63_08425, partial [Opitutus sp.]|nr:hypothetical protein [Opitutus sp.]
MAKQSFGSRHDCGFHCIGEFDVDSTDNQFRTLVNRQGWDHGFFLSGAAQARGTGASFAGFRNLPRRDDVDDNA